MLASSSCLEVQEFLSCYCPRHASIHQSWSFPPLSVVFQHLLLFMVNFCTTGFSKTGSNPCEKWQGDNGDKQKWMDSRTKLARESTCYLLSQKPQIINFQVLPPRSWTGLARKHSLPARRYVSDSLTCN
jgi:hypothetical protein